MTASQRHWPMKRLADVCEINPRREVSFRDDTLVSFVPMASIDEADGEVKLPEVRRYEEVKRGFTNFREGDILFAKITPCMENGKLAIARNLNGGYGFGSTEFHVLRPGLGLLNEWLFYFMRRREFRRAAERSFSGTAGQQRVPAAFLQDVPVPVPDLQTQRHLSEALARAASIIRLNKAAAAVAAFLLPGVFVEIFGHPRSARDSWNMSELGSLCEVRGGGTPSRAQPAYWNGTIPWISPKDFSAFHITGAQENITVEGIAQSATSLIPAGSLLVVVRSGILKHSIPLAINECPVAINQDVKALIPSGGLSVELMLAQLVLATPQLLASVYTGATVQSLSSEVLRNFKVVVPPRETQRTFTDRVRAGFELERALQRATTTANESYESLLHEIFDPREGATSRVTAVP